MEALSTLAPRVQPARLLRLVEIIGQREVTEAEAAENRRLAAQNAAELKQLEKLKKDDPARFDRDPELLRRLRDLRNASVRPRRARPAIPGLIPISESRWWDGVRKGLYPRPIKLSPGTTCWHSEQVYALLGAGAVEQGTPPKAAA